MRDSASDSSADALLHHAESELYDVYLESMPTAYKIAVIAVVRTLTGLGLKEAVELVDGKLPALIQEVRTLKGALWFKAMLEEGYFPDDERREWFTKSGRRREKRVPRDKTNDPPPGTACCVVTVRKYVRAKCSTA